MRATLTLLLSAALLSASSASAGEIKIGWYGQSFFQIVTPKGTRVVLDPHVIEEYRITPIKADLVLMSHLHNDHTQLEGAVENHKEVKQYNALKKTEGSLAPDWNLLDEKFADVRFFSVATYHDDISGMKAGKNGCWVLEIDGVRIAHLGDLGHKLNKAQIKKFGRIDVLMVPVGGVYTLNGLTAFEVVKQLDPKRHIVPMHYATPIYQDLLVAKTFLDECKDDELEIDTLKPRAWLTIDTKAAAPKRPRVSVLHYSGPGMGEIKVKGKEKDKDKEEK